MAAFALVLGAGALSLSACGSDDSSSSGGGSASGFNAGYCNKIFAAGCDKYMTKDAAECQKFSQAVYDTMPKCHSEMDARAACVEKNMNPKCVAGADGKTVVDDGVGTACDAESKAQSDCQIKNYSSGGGNQQ